MAVGDTFTEDGINKIVFGEGWRDFLKDMKETFGDRWKEALDMMKEDLAKEGKR